MSEGSADGRYIFIDAGLGEELQQLELSESPKAKKSMVERENFLNGNLALGRFVEGGSHCSVCALANGMQKLVIITLIGVISSSSKTRGTSYTPISNLGRGFGFLRDDMLVELNKPEVDGVIDCVTHCDICDKSA